MTRVHASAVAFAGVAALLRGPPGAGKSDLALRAIEAGAALVADDQVRLEAADGRLWARPLDRAGGRLEVRGLGIHAFEAAGAAPVGLLVDLAAPGEPAERLPEPETETLLGVELPRVRLDPFQASAVAKLRLALRRTAAGAREAAPDAGAGRAGGFRVVVVSGLSGAGRSTALKALEDTGFQAVDNLPPGLLGDLVAALRDGGRPIAVGIDARARDFGAGSLAADVARLRERDGLAVEILFLDASDADLERRFAETRRRHPLADGRQLGAGIAAERRLLAPLRAEADLALDSSGLSSRELRRLVRAHFSGDHQEGMSILVASFSFRAGPPREADLVMDARFLANPHYDPGLRPLDGRDPAVGAYIARDEAFAPFMERFAALAGLLLPRYASEGKSRLTIAIGCTGGRHRSVFVAERFAHMLRDRGWRATLVHRDIDDGAAASADTPQGDPLP